MLMMLSIMLLVLGAPFTLSARILYPDFCDEFTLAKNVPGIVTEIDNPRCFCIEACINSHIATLLLRNSDQQRSPTEEHYSMFVCGLSCFEPNYSISFGFLNESPDYVRFMQDRTLKKPVYLSEAQLYKVLTTGLDDGPYKRLINVLNDTLTEMVAAANTKDGQFVDGTQVDMGNVCFKNILQYSYDYEKINMLIEKQLYCRKSLQCLDVLLQYIVTNGYNGYTVDNIPHRQKWDYYACVRHTFLEANPVRYTPKPTTTATTTTSTTMAPIKTRRPKKVPWICYTVIGLAIAIIMVIAIVITTAARLVA